MLWLDNKKIFFIAFGCALIFSFNFCVWAKNYSDTAQKSIAKEIIRFHVLANSDSKFDQELKLKVRDGILKNLESQLKNSNNKSQTRLILEKNLLNIKNLAEKILINNGYSYKVKVFLTHEYFPTKKYGDIKLPAGNYDSLKLIIGEGKGRNWWCVMFPPLCFIDVTKKSVPNNLKKDFRNILSDEDFRLINSQNEKTRFKIKFKLVESWQSLNQFNKLASKE